MLISSGCEQSTRITAFDELSQFSLSTATITPTGIIAGSIDNGAAAHFNSTTEANFFWRTGGVNDSQQPVSAVALSADNNTAITASGSTLNLWDTQSGQSRHYLSAPATINAVAINPSGTRAALALDNKTAVVINLERGGIVQTWVHASPVLSVAINNKGVVLTGEEANAAHLWRLGVDEALVTQTHEDAVTLVAFDDSGDTAVTASRYDSVHFWQTAGKHETQYRISGKAMALKAGRRAVDIAFTAPNSVLVAFSDNTIEYRRFTQQTPIQRWALGKKTMLARENSTLIAIGQFKNSWRALMSDGRLYELGAL
ncbi:MAG TPA: hypothetical protein VIC26_04780 [Marinagarivorans sp.]